MSTTILQKGEGPPQLNYVKTGPVNPTTTTSTVLFIHPVGLDLTYYDRQIDALRGLYNVIAYDLPGHGRSAGDTTDCTYEKQVAAVVHIIEVTGGTPVHLVGLSVGGMIAQATVLKHPELIRTLTLIGTAPTFPDTVREGMRTHAEVCRKGGMEAVLPSLDSWVTQETREKRPHLIDRIIKTLLGDNKEIHAAMWEMISKFHVLDRLGEVGCPTLVLVGEQDPNTPPSVADLLKNNIKGAKMVVIPNASHMVTLEAPDAINAELLLFFVTN